MDDSASRSIAHRVTGHDEQCAANDATLAVRSHICNHHARRLSECLSRSEQSRPFEPKFSKRLPLTSSCGSHPDFERHRCKLCASLRFAAAALPLWLGIRKGGQSLVAFGRQQQSLNIGSDTFRLGTSASERNYRTVVRILPTDQKPALQTVVYGQTSAYGGTSLCRY